tara:strand:- start:368 stop:1015 length:648 start_codon:yes stop_codon:yes gene_type:complete
MKTFFRLNHKRCLLIFFIIIFGCGTDPVEEIIENYENGIKKIFVRFHSDPNVLERYIYNNIGEMVHFERDSLNKKSDFKDYMLGYWIMENMTIDGDTIFNRSGEIDSLNDPNIYHFTKNKLVVKGYEYFADYKILYLDSTRIEMEGTWQFGSEGEETFRKQRIYDIKYFQIESYTNILWDDFLNDDEKEEIVRFRRLLNYQTPTFSDSLALSQDQ